MRRFLLFFTIILLLWVVFMRTPVAYADYDKDLLKPEGNIEKEQEKVQPDPILPNIFIWQMPDEVFSDEETDDYYGYDEVAEEEQDDITQLKGYLDYIDDVEAITLKKEDNQLVLNLRVPQKFSAKNITGKAPSQMPQTSFSRKVYARSGNLLYNIEPLDTSAVLKQGNFSIGTSYNESIDYSDLGFTTSFYTKYENKYFSLSTSYDKTSGLAYTDVIDKFSFSPELKLNRYISIKDIITSDITRNRQKNEVILSIKPGHDDRIRFEFGAGQTYDENSVLLRSQIKFSTQYKW